MAEVSAVEFGLGRRRSSTLKVVTGGGGDGGWEMRRDLVMAKLVSGEGLVVTLSRMEVGRDARLLAGAVASVLEFGGIFGQFL